jgi:molecular chaperone GrpE
MPASEETGSGPVIHDHRRIDPVTGQVRGKHAASKPAGTTGAGRPAAAPGSAGSAGAGETGGAGGTSGTGDGASGPDDVREGQGAQGGDVVTEEILDGIVEDKTATGFKQAGAKQPGPEQSGAKQSVPNQSGAKQSGPDQSGAEARLAERTADLQRLQAEYANYRKRVDRDRAAVREQAVATALTGLLPVMDAIDQAREHGELSGGFKSVADSLASALTKLGLVAYGEKGDPFDPKIHEALTHTYSPDVTEDTCVEIFQPGYKVGERILRPARVAVAAPATGPDGASNEARSDDEDGD